MEISAAIHLNTKGRALKLPPLVHCENIIKSAIAQEIANANELDFTEVSDELSAAVRILDESNDRPDAPEQVEVPPTENAVAPEPPGDAADDTPPGEMGKPPEEEVEANEQEGPGPQAR